MADERNDLDNLLADYGRGLEGVIEQRAALGGQAASITNIAHQPAPVARRSRALPIAAALVMVLGVVGVVVLGGPRSSVSDVDSVASVASSGGSAGSDSADQQGAVLDPTATSVPTTAPLAAAQVTPQPTQAPASFPTSTPTTVPTEVAASAPTPTAEGPTPTVLPLTPSPASTPAPTTGATGPSPVVTCAAPAADVNGNSAIVDEPFDFVVNVTMPSELADTTLVVQLLHGDGYVDEIPHQGETASWSRAAVYRSAGSYFPTIAWTWNGEPQSASCGAVVVGESSTQPELPPTPTPPVAIANLVGVRNLMPTVGDPNWSPHYVVVPAGVVDTAPVSLLLNGSSYSPEVTQWDTVFRNVSLDDLGGLDSTVVAGILVLSDGTQVPANISVESVY